MGFVKTFYYYLFYFFSSYKGGQFRDGRENLNDQRNLYTFDKRTDTLSDKEDIS